MKASKRCSEAATDESFASNTAVREQVAEIDNLFSAQLHQFSTLWNTPLHFNKNHDENAGKKHDEIDGEIDGDNTYEIQRQNNDTSRLKFSSISSRFPHASENAVSMWIADMDTAPSKHIARAISTFVSSQYGYQSVNIGDVVSARYAKQNTIIASDSVVGTASVMAAVDTALKVCTRAGDKVMVLSPTYGPLRERIKAQGLEIVDIGDTNKADVEQSLMSVSQLNSNCTAFVLCHPNNPTGTVLSEQLQSDIADFCETHNITLILDEVHSEFGFIDASASSNNADTSITVVEPKAIRPFAIGNKTAQRTIIRINSAGKAFNLSAIPGASYAIIADENLRNRFAREIDNCHLEASPVAKIALIAAYENADDWLAIVLKAIAFNRQYTEALMNVLSPTTPFTLGDAGYFLWVNLKQRFSNNMFEIACKRGVIGVDGASFNAPGYLRLNLACHPSAIKAALLRLFTG
ncbi:aminotransferase class I/II-fold pyridoxal phosphate-dependent enzyme [Alteromonas sp. 1_MG-2023]|uniref:aminotransferase class I/II-fold pyridoxal phosphate-dependent enzyme n=1 Tax=Alteromonas sp. 1_MG-2023 TaxID=3062669 RepID=UPI0026E419BE|nr:aminotransferase class I/II-fold pyridoxal phosphate-dependent enzyme [Alteromonas sp. 1_MG-2023]MDO6565816.1 aminotransferase class I/II-fold pyridoxal phosphate-dependent enzyme [Alteromonas sp. 1_MG-2023]